MRKINKAGFDMIKSFEGCKLKAYKCLKSEQYYTIGYGHYGIKDGNMTITQDQAESLLLSDLEHFEDHVEKIDNNYNYNFNDNEFSALVSFAFNIGGIIQLTQGGKRSKAEIADAMLLYNKAGGSVLTGLSNRRKKERELFLTKPTVSQEVSVMEITEDTPLSVIVDNTILGMYGNGSYRKDAYYDIIQCLHEKRKPIWSVSFMGQSLVN